MSHYTFTPSSIKVVRGKGKEREDMVDVGFERYYREGCTEGGEKGALRVHQDLSPNSEGQKIRLSCP